MYGNIEIGNAGDKAPCTPVLNASQKDYGRVPVETVADGGYASHGNVAAGRELGVDRRVFNKRCGLSYHAMSVKKKPSSPCEIFVLESKGISRS